MPVNWEGTEKMVRRAEAAGCPVLVWTVDLLGGRNTEISLHALELEGRTRILGLVQDRSEHRKARRA